MDLSGLVTVLIMISGLASFPSLSSVHEWACEAAWPLSEGIVSSLINFCIFTSASLFSLFFIAFHEFLPEPMNIYGILFLVCNLLIASLCFAFVSSRLLRSRLEQKVQELQDRGIDQFSDLDNESSAKDGKEEFYNTL